MKSLNSLHLKNISQIVLSRSIDIEEGMHLLKQNPFDLIFLDYFLPDGNGLDFLKRLEKEDLEIPVVVITGQGDEMIASHVIQAGAYDYLTNNRVSEESLSQTIVKTLEKSRLKGELKKTHKKIAEMSTIDGLTGLYNRRYMKEILEREISRAIRYNSKLAFSITDIDHFKHINDTYGHPIGDKVLSEVGGLFRGCVRQSDTVCRYGGE